MTPPSTRSGAGAMGRKKSLVEQFTGILSPKDLGEALLASMEIGGNCNIEHALDLIRRGAALDVTNPNGFTALHFAANRGYTAIVKALAEKGVDMNAQTLAGNTPLSLAVIQRDGMRKEIIEILVAHGANLETTDSYEETALMKAVIYKHLEYIKTLLALGADPKVKDAKGVPATERGNEETKALLTEAIEKRREEKFREATRCFTDGLSHDLGDIKPLEARKIRFRSASLP